MALIARASTTVRNKNLLIALMCVVFLCWFAYDGYVGYGRGNDRLVEVMRGMVGQQRLDAKWLPQVSPRAADNPGGWPGWDLADEMTRERLGDLAKNEAKVEGWRSELDISLQRWIVAGLIFATGGAIGWFIHCQRRRCIAEETTVSPAPGVVIPWDKITRVDNTRWDKMGIVEITYTDNSGASQTARFDDYQIDREPLLSILDQLADKAVNAEFIPQPEPPAPAPASAAPPPPGP